MKPNATKTRTIRTITLAPTGISESPSLGNLYRKRLLESKNDLPYGLRRLVVRTDPRLASLPVVFRLVPEGVNLRPGCIAEFSIGNRAALHANMFLFMDPTNFRRRLAFPYRKDDSDFAADENDYSTIRAGGKDQFTLSVAACAATIS